MLRLTVQDLASDNYTKALSCSHF